jgi:U3 small nucleolar RNA-associated protein 21
MHGDVIVANEELREALERLRDVQKGESERVMELIDSSLGTLWFVRSTS